MQISIELNTIEFVIGNLMGILTATILTAKWYFKWKGKNGK